MLWAKDMSGVTYKAKRRSIVRPLINRKRMPCMLDTGTDIK